MRAPNCATGPLSGQHSIVAHGGGTGNKVVPRPRSGRSDRLRRLTRVSQGEPPGQESGGLIRGRSIEGHQRCRHPGAAPELRAPPVANRCDLNLIQAAADIVLEVVNGHRWSMSCVMTEAQILRGRYVGSSEARREDAVHKSPESDRLAIRAKKNLRCQLLHRFCTIHAQLFHNGAANGGFEPKPRSSR